MTTPSLSYEPAGPDPITDGVLFTAKGSVKLAQIQIRDADNNVRLASTAFGQKDTIEKTNQKDTVAIVGTPAGGTFTLTLDGADETIPIPYNATNAQIRDAIQRAWGNAGAGLAPRVVAVTGDGPFTVEFLDETAHTVAQGTNSLTGGSSPHITVTQVTAGGAARAGGPFLWGPVYLPDEDLTADLVAIVDDGGTSAGDSYLSGPIYFYGD